MSTIGERAISFFIGNVVAWQGIRQIDENNYILVGTINDKTESKNQNGYLYIGNIDGSSISRYILRYPNAVSTSLYGPNYLDNGIYQLCGSYKMNDGKINGFYFMGTLNDFNNKNSFTQINTGRNVTFCHSILDNWVVGNTAFSSSNNENNEDKINIKKNKKNAFIYNIKKKEIYYFKFPGSKLTTVYCICKNKNHYTLCGGYTNTKLPIDLEIKDPIGIAYIVDFCPKSKNKFFNWRSFSYPLPNTITHFQGISNIGNDKFTVCANIKKNDGTFVGSWAKINDDKIDKWITVKFPNIDGKVSCNSVSGKKLVGVNLNLNESIAFQSLII